MESGVVVVLVTAPRGRGKEIARSILEKRLAACVNVGSVESLYWWKGKIEEDKENLLVIKTSISRLEELVEEIKRVHPYEVPEILALPVVACLDEYCDWVRKETSKQST